MQHSNPERELEELLGESVEEAESRTRSFLAQTFDQEPSIVLFGAGFLGQQCAAGLQAAGVRPLAFADDTPSKQGQSISGIPVITLDAAARKYGETATFVVTINNAAHRYGRSVERLTGLGCRRVAPFLALAWNYAGTFLPYYQFDLPASVLRQARAIREAFALFGDNESRRQFVAHLRFRLFLDFAALPANSPDKYFPADIFKSLSPEIVYVDCGAFDGDTLRMFLDRHRAGFKRAVVFEPDPRTFERLKGYISSLSDDVRGKIRARNAAIGLENSLMSFNAMGEEGSAFDPAGSTQVEVVSLDQALKNEHPTFIKFDIEGAEQDALRGGRNLIQTLKPTLAVSVYHRPGDMWEVPLYLKGLNEDYAFFLRTEGEDGFGTVCYAVASRT
ncbi:MAG TPA: FkbM family methyltransferase [Pyrinomonadaceae bacterium]|jgi:FkbM family methyltransferase